MFTGFMYIALAVCLLLCACTEGDLGDEMSFDTLLRAAIMIKDYINGFILISRALPLENRVRDKVRDRDITSVYAWSMLVLRSVS